MAEVKKHIKLMQKRRNTSSSGTEELQKVEKELQKFDRKSINYVVELAEKYSKACEILSTPCRLPKKLETDWFTFEVFDSERAILEDDFIEKTMILKTEEIRGQISDLADKCRRGESYRFSSAAFDVAPYSFENWQDHKLELQQLKSNSIDIMVMLKLIDNWDHSVQVIKQRQKFSPQTLNDQAFLSKMYDQEKKLGKELEKFQEKYRSPFTIDDKDFKFDTFVITLIKPTGEVCYLLRKKQTSKPFGDRTNRLTL